MQVETGFMLGYTVQRTKDGDAGAQGGLDSQGCVFGG